MEPNAVASARDAVGPTCRMLRATTTRHSGRDFAASRFSSSLSPLVVTSPVLRTTPSFLESASSVNSGTRARAASVNANRPASFASTPDSTSAAADFSPSTSTSSAPRPPMKVSRSMIWPRQPCELGQRRSTSPSSLLRERACRTTGTRWAWSTRAPCRCAARPRDPRSRGSRRPLCAARPCRRSTRPCALPPARCGASRWRRWSPQRSRASSHRRA